MLLRVSKKKEKKKKNLSPYKIESFDGNSFKNSHILCMHTLNTHLKKVAVYLRKVIKNQYFK